MVLAGGYRAEAVTYFFRLVFSSTCEAKGSSLGGRYMNQEIGKRFPDLELPDQDNNKVKLSAISNGQPLIVSFYRGYW